MNLLHTTSFLTRYYLAIGEGCEWETYQDWLGDDIPLLHQILVEVHDCPDSVLDFMDSFEKVGYLRYHKEPNIQSDPNCLELGMIKVSSFFIRQNRFQALLPYPLLIHCRYQKISWMESIIPLTKRNTLWRMVILSRVDGNIVGGFALQICCICSRWQGRPKEKLSTTVHLSCNGMSTYRENSQNIVSWVNWFTQHQHLFEK